MVDVNARVRELAVCDNCMEASPYADMYIVGKHKLCRKCLGKFSDPALKNVHIDVSGFISLKDRKTIINFIKEVKSGKHRKTN